jgi:hypothetical protein
MYNLSSKVKITKVANHTADGIGAVVSAALDMTGYLGVLFLTSFGTAAANNTILASQDIASGGAYTDLLGTSVTSGTSDEDVWVDVVNPTKRYVRVEIARGTSSTLESIWAIQYGGSQEPVDNTTTGTIVGESHLAVEGTA